MSAHNSTQLKSTLRSGLATEEDRRRLWPKAALPIDEDEDPIDVARRLCKLLKDQSLSSTACNPEKYSSDGEYVTDCRNRITLAIERHKSIANATFLESLVTVIVYTMKNLEVSYYMMSTLIDQHNRYFLAIEGDLRLYVMTETFKDILASFIPKTYAVLRQLRALQPHFLTAFFNDFFLEIFPKNILMNMMDSFLLEGVKILYRYGAAVMCLYKSRIKNNAFATAEEFWAAVKQEARISATTKAHASDDHLINQESRLLPEILGMAGKLSPLLSPTAQPTIKSNRLIFSISLLKQRAFDMERSIGSKLMRPLNISRSYLQRKHQYYIGQFYNPRGRDEDEDRRDVVLSNGGMPRAESHQGLFATNTQGIFGFGGSGSGAGAADEEEHRDSPPPSPIPVRTIFKLPSTLMSPEQIAALGAALPETSQWVRWTLRYNANRDGWDLSHVYQLLQKKHPVLFLFHLQSPYEDTILGALHSDIIAPPNAMQIRGQGSINRVFVLNHGQLTCFPWVGLLQSQPGVMDNSPSPDHALATGTTATQTQFAVCAPEFIAFGGSHTQFTNALRWEAGDTSCIITGHSDTYQNPPLFEPAEGQSPSSSHSYALRDVEIFSGP